MSTSQQLQQDLQNELTVTNQLLKLIALELQQIKVFTSPNGMFENNIKENASLLETLASIQHVDLENVPPLNRISMKDNIENITNVSYEMHDTTTSMEQSP